MKLNFSGEEILPEDKEYIAYALSDQRVSKHLKSAKLHVKQYRKSGFRRKTVLNLIAQTSFGNVNVDASAWQFNKAVNSLAKKVDKYLLKHEEMKKEHSSVRKRKLPRFLRFPKK